jgi:hypothetical protein
MFETKKRQDGHHPSPVEAIFDVFGVFGFGSFEPRQRAHSPQRAAGLASELKIRLNVLTVEDSYSLLQGSSICFGFRASDLGFRLWPPFGSTPFEGET